MSLFRSCHDVHRLVAESMDRPLPLGVRLSVRLHLAGCDACTHFKRQMLWLRAAMQRLDGR